MIEKNKFNGFSRVQVTMPNGAEFNLSIKDGVIRTEDFKNLIEWLNEGRARMGLPGVRKSSVDLKTNMPFSVFNKLAKDGILPTDQVTMAYYCLDVEVQPSHK